MAYIDETPVYYEGFLVGRITLDAKLTYDPRWLATNGSFPLSVTLPLASRTYEGSALLTWLANLLPEGPNLIGISRALGLSTSDVLAILKAIGGDTAGAFSIGLPSIRDDWRYSSAARRSPTVAGSSDFQYSHCQYRRACKELFDDPEFWAQDRSAV
ncbi:HipA N-terminal domain-containing protein [Pseudophaeobacter sp. MA21411-1]|nr:HipA N-terminal domain-containing protein [Pseudophaeobacter flagellatus]MCD9149918.1 HipA N-terminal domain-containing protein [Pseudophaeobacter flagellatus]